MKRYIYYIVFSIFISFLLASPPKPDYFGVFLVNGKNLIELKHQDVAQKNLVGYMTTVLIGLREIKNIALASESAYFIIYGQPQSILNWKITKLKFQEEYIDKMIKPEPFKIDMWLPEYEVRTVSSTIENLKDCYILKPKELLSEGTYALHFHSLEPLSKVTGAIDRIVYPFAVGATRQDVRGAEIANIPIYNICFSQKNPKLYYVGSKECIFQKTKEAYRKIVSPKLKGNLSLVSVDPANTQHLFVSSYNNSKMFSSKDGGVNWKEEVQLYVTDALGNPYSLYFNNCKFDLDNPNVVATAAQGTRGDRKDGIFIASLDGGENWEYIINRDNAVFDVISNGKDIFFSTNKAIYRFNIEKKKTIKIDTIINIKHLRYSYYTKQIYGATSDGKIYISENNGQSFRLLFDTKSKIIDLVADPKSDSTLWFVTYQEIYKTEDRGKNWEKATINGFEEGEILCLNINPENNNEIYVGTSQGLYISRDRGKDWMKEK